MTRAEEDEEFWLPVPSAKGWFASSWGRVKAFRVVPMPMGGHKTIEVKPTKGRPEKGTGRFRVCAMNRTRRVAQMVCEAFHGERPPRHECMHLDENCQNDVPSNLQWGTKSQNQKAPKLRQARSDAYKELYGEKSPAAKKLTNEKVREIKRKLANKEIRKADIAREYGVSSGMITMISKGQVWSRIVP